MNFISQVSPRKAYADLRLFLSQEQPFKLLFLALALIPAIGLVVALILDAKAKSAPLPPEVIYVESWPIDRSMAVIMKEREERRIARAEREAKVKSNYKVLGRAVGMDVEEIEAEAAAERPVTAQTGGQTDTATPARSGPAAPDPAPTAR
ncbi:hypothetical protein [Novosphingopyxis baekryungensis]|uniref:hypothetical protein n=1 Tax=Novosphingopyxis baekryungensis TaxID=279369 RepID=UPI000413F729|nr:hypothetical protein [Novosphingopyxis baekryungensis]